MTLLIHDNMNREIILYTVYFLMTNILLQSMNLSEAHTKLNDEIKNVLAKQNEDNELYCKLVSVSALTDWAPSFSNSLAELCDAKCSCKLCK